MATLGSEICISIVYSGTQPLESEGVRHRKISRSMAQCITDIKLKCDSACMHDCFRSLCLSHSLQACRGHVHVHSCLGLDVTAVHINVFFACLNVFFFLFVCMFAHFSTCLFVYIFAVCVYVCFLHICLSACMYSSWLEAISQQNYDEAMLQ